MTAYDLYQSSKGSFNASSSRAFYVGVKEEQSYYEPQVLMTGQIWIDSSRQPRPLISLPSSPPAVIAPILNAQLVAAQVAPRIQHLASIEAVYVKTKPWGFEYWLVANGSTEEIRFSLYDIEWQLMELNPEVGFKFHLVDRQGRALAEVVTLEPFDAMVVLGARQDA